MVVNLNSTSTLQHCLSVSLHTQSQPISYLHKKIFYPSFSQPNVKVATIQGAASNQVHRHGSMFFSLKFPHFAGIFQVARTKRHTEKQLNAKF